ncbi:MAG: MBL fold metallo-hydrolase [Acidobacteria bacterium]|nr:MBL fold metallo-hydrolase [Acidobacteriota bacterium]
MSEDRMKKIVIAMAAVVALLPLQLRAQKTGQDTGAVIAAATAAMGGTSLRAIQYSGTGSTNPTGQAYTSGGPWPRFTVTKYQMSVNFTVPAMQQELIRIDDAKPPRGGGAGGFNPATGQGGIRPIPGDIIQNQVTDGRTEVGALNVWLTPHGFLKGVAANVATATVTTVRGKRALSFTAFGKYTVTGTLSDQNLVERVETRMDVSFTGDTLFEGIYSEYRDLGGLKFPMRIVLRQGGFPTLELKVADVQPNSAAALEVRGPAPRGGGPPAAAAARVEPEKIADGVWFMTPGAEGSTLVEFNDYVVLVEGPGSDAQTMATIANAKRMLPNKPIKYVINTHHHADHAGGLRAYVAEGIPIITHESHKPYYEQQIFKSPHTINPDRLARAPRVPTVETVKDKRVLTDGKMTLEVHLIRDHAHAEGLLMVYIPSEKLLIQADAFAPRPGAKPLPAPSPYTINLVDNVARLKLDVARVVHVHGGISPFADVLKAAGR